jgi:hypothetical protein
MCTKYKLLKTNAKLVVARELRLALPEDAVQHSETYRRNVVNILLYKYICVFSWYICGDFRYIFGLFL